MKAINQLKTFQRILEEYPAETPLSKFLPGFYRQNKQMGSTDRRVANRLIYNYFRLGNALPNLPADERCPGEIVGEIARGPLLELR